MGDASKKDVSTSEDVVQEESVSNDCGEEESDDSDTSDMLNKNTLEISDEDNEEGEDNTDEVYTQEQSMESNDVQMVQNSEDAKHTSNEGLNAKSKKKRRKNKTGDKEEAMLETPRRHDKHPCLRQLFDYAPRPYDVTRQSRFEPPALAEAQCLWVDTVDYLEELAGGLMCEEEIGVVVRYNTNTYKSPLCVILISTKDTNYMIDCLKLGKHLELLKPVFLSPDVIKVVDGNRLLRNLQVDCDMWFMNIFDVKLAFKKLAMHTSYLEYVNSNFNVGKYLGNHHLCNWQVRPLPELFQKSALVLVHYLIPVYRELKNHLIEADLIQHFLDICNKECGLIFESKLELKDIVPDLAFLQANQAATLVELDAWRHRMGQKKNRNVNVVMNNRHMQALAREMPTKPSGILALAKTAQVVKHLGDVLKIIKTCRQAIGPAFVPPHQQHYAPPPLRHATDGYSRSRQSKFAKNHRGRGANRGTFKSKRQQFNNHGGRSHSGSREDDSFDNHDDPYENNTEDRFESGSDHRFSDRHVPFNRGSRNQFTASYHEPRAKRSRTDPYNNRRSWARDLPPLDRPNSPSYLMVSNKGEAFQVENNDMLSNFMQDTRTESMQRENRDGNRWQNRNQNNGSAWEQSGNSMGSINTLLNLSSTLMNLNRQGGSRDDRRSRTGYGGEESFIPNRDNWRNSSGEQDHQSPLECLDVVSYPNRSQLPYARQSQRSHEGPYRKSQRFPGAYQNQSQRPDIVCYPIRSQSSASHSDRSQSPDVVTYPIRSDLVTYPNRSQNPYGVLDPDESLTLDVVSYPKYDPSRYSKQGF